MAKARAGPARRKTRAVSAIIASARTKAKAVNPTTSIGSARKWSTTPSIAAMANVDIGNHAPPVDAFTLRLDKGVAANATDDQPRAKSAPAMIANSLNPKATGEASAVPR